MEEEMNEKKFKLFRIIDELFQRGIDRMFPCSKSYFHRGVHIHTHTGNRQNDGEFSKET